MSEDIKQNSIIPICSSDLVRVGNSIALTNKILKEHDERFIEKTFETIGNQKWCIKNLYVSRYRNGDIIPQVQDEVQWASLTTGAWCYYQNDPDNGFNYGKLYNWFAVDDVRGLAPLGFHIPTDLEWKMFYDYLGTFGGESWRWLILDFLGKYGKIAFLPGGCRDNNGMFFERLSFGYWWSSKEVNISFAWNLRLSCIINSENMNSKNKRHGFSVRCIKD